MCCRFIIICCYFSLRSHWDTTPDLPLYIIGWCYLVSGQSEALGNHPRTETGSQEREYHLTMS